MKKIYLFPVLILFSVLILGCPYKSKVAIDEYAKTKIDNNLIGVWIVKDTNNTEVKNPSYYIIKDRNGYMLDIDKYAFTDTNEYVEEETELSADTAEYEANEEEYVEPSGIFKVSETYEAFLSDIDGIKFLNVRQLEDFSGFGYYLYKITFKGKNEFYLSPVTDYIKKNFVTSNELRDYIKKYKEIEFFFGVDEYYVRYELPK
jgi:hypothetical protein